MLFLQPILLLATTALAASPLRRQSSSPADLPQAFSIIEADTTALKTATEAFISDFCPLIAATSTLLSDIQAGITLAQASPELTIDQVIAVIGPTQSLATAVDSAIDSTIAKYDAFVAAGFASVVYNGLITQQRLSGQFSDAVVAALPEGLRDAGRMNAAPIAASLARGVAAFADAPGSETPPSCDGSSSSSSSSTSSTSSSISTSSSASTSSSIPTSSSSSVVAPQPYPYPIGSSFYPTTTAAPKPYPSSSPPTYHGSGTPPKYHSSDIPPPSYGSYAPHPYPSKETHPPVYDSSAPHASPSSKKPHHNPPIYGSLTPPHAYPTKEPHPPIYETVTVHPMPPVYTKPHPSVQPSIQPTPPIHHSPKTERPNASYPVETITVTPPKPYHPVASFVPAPENPSKPETPKGSQAPPVEVPPQKNNPPAYAPAPSPTKSSPPNAPSATYSPPAEYTGGAMKSAAAGIGSLAMAVAAVMVVL